MELTEEQKKRIEENRLKALALKRMEENRRKAVALKQFRAKFKQSSSLSQGVGLPAGNLNLQPANVLANVQTANNYNASKTVKTNSYDAKSPVKDVGKPIDCITIASPPRTGQSSGHIVSKSPSATNVQSNPSKSYFSRPSACGQQPSGSENFLAKPYANNSLTTTIKPKSTAPTNATPYTCPQAKEGGGPPLPSLYDRLTKVSLSVKLASIDRLDVNFNYNIKVIDKIKQLKTSSWIPERKCWSINLCDYKNLLAVGEQLKKEGTEIHMDSNTFSPRVLALLLTFKNNAKKEDIVLQGQLRPQMVDKMFPFQREGVQFGVSRDGRCIIADEMGLGKTIQALALAAWYKEDWPLLIVCPASVANAWKNAVVDWLTFVDEKEIEVVSDSKTLANKLVMIMSYDRMVRSVDEILSRKMNFVIFDECHSIKNDIAKRTKAALKLANATKRLILLSGTPALSRPMELFTQIQAVNPKLFPTKHEFGVRYCDAKLGAGYGIGHKQIWDYRGSSNSDELRIILESTIMIRRMKVDVLKDLLPKRRTTVTLPLKISRNDAELMVTYENAMKNSAGRGKKFDKEVLFEWYHETAKLKIPALVDYVRKFLEKDVKFLCFAYHKNVMDSISEMLQNESCAHIRIDGKTPTHIRQECCDYFQDNADCKVALVSMLAAGVGITLTAASYVIFTELYWNPGILTQVSFLHCDLYNIF